MPEAIISASGVQYPLIINPDGSINTTISGGIHIGSVSANVDSVYIQSGANIVGSAYVYQKTDPWIVLGSVAIDPPISVTTGSKVYPYVDSGGTFVLEPFKREVAISGTISTTPGSEVFMPAGSVIVTSMPAVSVTTGSESWIKNVVGVTPSGTFDVDTGLYVGSESWVKETPKTEVYGSGTFEVTGEFSTGSEVYVQNFGDIGSKRVITNLGDLGSSVTQGTDPWVISGVISNLSEVSVTAGSESWIKNVVGVTPSGTFDVETNLYAGSKAYIPAGSVIVTNRVAGSIVNMPSIIGSVNIDNADEVGGYAGSIAIVDNFGDLGSKRVITNVVGVTPSGTFDVETNLYAGSESVVTAGSVHITNPDDVGGYAGSEVWEQNIYTGSKVYQGNRFGISGIVDIGNFGDLGSKVVVTNFGILGSSVTQGTTPWVISGVISNLDEVTVTTGSESWIKNYGDLGSKRVITNVIGVTPSGTFDVDTNLYAGSHTYIPAGSVIVTNLDEVVVTVGSESYIPAGSVIVTNLDEVVVTAGSESYIKAGSIQPYSQLGSVEIWQKTAADLVVSVDSPTAIGSYTTQTVDGTITVTGIATAGSLAIQEVIGSVNIDNAGDVGGYPGSNLFVTPSGTFEVETNLEVGSEVWMPAGSLHLVNPGDISVSAGSEAVVTAGSIQTYTQLGSVEIWQKTAADLITNANVTNFGDLGSKVVIDSPVTIGSYTTQTVDGTVTANVDSYLGSKIYQGDRFGVSGIIEVSNRIAGSIVNMPTVVVSSTNLDIRDLSSASDSITATINSPATIGSYTTQTIAGTVTANVDSYLGSNAYIPAGSVIITNSPDVDIGDTGSVRAIISAPASIGSYTTQTVGGTVGITSPAAIGSYTTQTVDGAVDVNNVATIGSYTLQLVNGSVHQLTNPWIVIGSIAQTNVGSVIQSTSPWVISGNALITGSVNITNDLNLAEAGSPCFKQATATASGTYTEVWKVGTGSKLEIHGWKISTQLPGYVRMLRSGTTPIVIADYYMAYASGAIIEKTFVTPIVPGGANVQAGVGTTVAGSTAITIYGREIK